MKIEWVFEMGVGKGYCRSFMVFFCSRVIEGKGRGRVKSKNDLFLKGSV